VEKVLVVQRSKEPINMVADRDYWWHDLQKQVSANCPAEPMDSEDMLFILYTSGSTGKPKGVVHTTGGYNLYTHVTSKWIFDLKDTDVYWCTADVGWITGHSYIVYGPLSNGATTVMYEGVPRPSNLGCFWDVIEKYRVNIFYTAPTAIRTFIKMGKTSPIAGIYPLCAYWEPWENRLTRKRGCGITGLSVRKNVRLSILGGKRKPGEL
jgi:acetyl-CoA synthetase